MRRIAVILAGLVLLVAAIALVVSPVFDSQADQRAPSPTGRLLVLGVDGMDPQLLGELMDAGRMPNFSRLAAEGGFRALETSIPPQSPVAWSNMISGANPGTHEIYDFIHRDPNPKEPHLALKPYLSTSEVVPAERRDLTFRQWRFPLAADDTRLLRQGPAFWDFLSRHGVETTVYRIPANYPPPQAEGPGACACLCGMGTPDLLGTYGSFTFFTPNAPPDRNEVAGGRVEYWKTSGDRFTGTLIGPHNFLRAADETGDVPKMTVAFTVTRDPDAAVAKIEVEDRLLLLNEGEWSEWVPVEFSTGIPGASLVGALDAPTSIAGMVRFYVKQVHPRLQVYVSPLNIDPLRPTNPISSPPELAGRLARKSGRYYTTGIPQDTKALRGNVLDEDEFLQQCRIVLDERIEQYRQALHDFERGCLFFYFGAVDQLSHIFWRDRDAQHPGRLAEQGERYSRVIEDCYEEMDGLLGEALDVLGKEDTVIVLSDHGFTSFRRGLNLNSWLVENGYITLFDRSTQGEYEMFLNVNWSKTVAYALGLNGLYINLRGREKAGIVGEGADYEHLLAEISESLLQVRDEDGRRAIEAVYRVDDVYPDANRNIAPDLIVGYAAGYRASWATALGSMPLDVFEDNLDRWSGDHCNAATVVPGILVTNRKLAYHDPSLSDIGPTILQVFGIRAPLEMQGRRLFREN